MAGLSETARVLELAFLAGSHVGFALRRALSAAVEEGRIPPLAAAVDRQLSERLTALHTKQAYLPTLVGRVRAGWEKVRDLARERDPALDRYALKVERGDEWRLLVDVESLLLTLHSTLDVADSLAKLVERRVVKLPRDDQTPDERLGLLPGISEEEQKLFRDVRGEVAHVSSPWLAVVLDSHSGDDLAILTRRDPDYRMGEGYVLLSRMDAMLRALQEYVDGLERSLVELLEAQGA